MNISVCLWNQDCMSMKSRLYSSALITTHLFDIIIKYGVSQEMNFLGNHNLSIRVLECVLFELSYLQIFLKYIECFFASEVTCHDFASLFCLILRVNIINILLPCRIVIQKCFSVRGEGHLPIQNGLRLLWCLFICSFWICISLFFCILHHNLAISCDFLLILLGLCFLVYCLQYIMSWDIILLTLLKFCIQQEYTGTKWRSEGLCK